MMKLYVCVEETVTLQFSQMSIYIYSPVKNIYIVDIEKEGETKKHAIYTKLTHISLIKLSV